MLPHSVAAMYKDICDQLGWSPLSACALGNAEKLEARDASAKKLVVERSRRM